MRALVLVTIMHFMGLATYAQSAKGHAASGAKKARPASSAKVKMRAECHMTDDGSIVGEQLDSLYEIASVSKVMTTYWAINQMGPDFRFKTLVHVKQNPDGSADIHIEGGRDPFFSAQTLEFLLSELNELKITKINKLSFDEQLVFLLNPRDDKKVAEKNPEETEKLAGLESVSDVIYKFIRQKQFYKIDKGLNLNYLSKQSEKYNDVEMPKKININLSVNDYHVGYISKQDFYNKFYDSKLTKTYTLKSVPLHTILKEMNRNSNNFAANIIFEELGGVDQFKTFMKNNLNLGDNDFRFVNGSGYPYCDTTKYPQGCKADEKVYNQATCRSVLKVLKALDATIKAKNGHIEDVMAVAGKEDPDKNLATTIIRYDATPVKYAMVAKTGTIDMASTLGGLMYTKNATVYFFYNVWQAEVKYADARNAEISASRKLIEDHVLPLAEQFGGALPVDENLQVKPFIPFDAQSKLVFQQNINLDNVKAEMSIPGVKPLARPTELAMITNAEDN